MIWLAKDLSSALNTEIHPNIQGKQIQFNSNSVINDDLFIALQGNTDGNNYALHALEHGANAVIISKEIKGLPSDKVIKVSSTLNALHQMAEYKRKKSKARFIGITGSIGKTSTKEAIKTILNHFSPTFVSRGNFNNHLGVLINLASMPDNVKYAVFEMGMSHSGEIKKLTKMVRPSISVITPIVESHLEFFKSMLHLVDVKCEIFTGMPKDGIAIINSDHQYYARVLYNLKQVLINNVYDFGKSPYANSRLTSYEQIGQEVRLHYSICNTKIDIKIPFIPEHYAQNYTAALQLSAILNLDVNVAAKQLGKISLIEGRGKLVTAKYYNQNYQIICDYYNANPTSVKAALLYLKQLSGKKKVAILGDMLELGKNSIKLHKGLISTIVDSGAKKVFLVGSNVKHIYQSLPNEIQKVHFDNVNLLINNLNKLLTGNELILIKGSRSIQLNKIIQSFELQ